MREITITVPFEGPSGAEIEVEIVGTYHSASIEKHGLEMPPYEHIPAYFEDIMAFITLRGSNKKIEITNSFTYLEIDSFESLLLEEVEIT